MFSALIYCLEKMGLTKTVKTVKTTKTDPVKVVKAVDKKKLAEDRKAVEKALDKLSIIDDKKEKKGGGKTDKANKAIKAKKIAEETSVKKTTTTKVKAKKVFSILGQTKTTPPETDSLRKFYTSLLVQNPESKMAMEWCLERGLIPEKSIKKIMKKLGKNVD